MLDLIYKVEVAVEIKNVEAGLLYKYLKTYPEGTKYLQEDQFAFDFKEFENKSKFYVNLNLEMIDICVGALEDQEFNDPLENILKQDFLKKLYVWSKIICKEEESIEDLQVEYDCLKYKMMIDETEYFTFLKYCSLKNQFYSNSKIRKPKNSLLNKIKKMLFSDSNIV